MNNKPANRTVFASILTFAILAFASFAAFGQAVMTPSALVADLYRVHNAHKSPFFQDKNRALVDKYFTKATADLIWKDATTARGEVGALDGDPLYDAQDTQIKRFMVGAAVVAGEKATVPVTFTNYGKKKTVTFALVKEGVKWKIDDISYGTDYTLVSLLKEDAAGSEDAEFKGEYQVGTTSCTVTPVKMAFEVRWKKGTGVEMFFFKDKEGGKVTYETEPDNMGRTNKFVFDDESLNSGTYVRSDGKTMAIKRGQ